LRFGVGKGKGDGPQDYSNNAGLRAQRCGEPAESSPKFNPIRAGIIELMREAKRRSRGWKWGGTLEEFSADISLLVRSLRQLFRGMANPPKQYSDGSLIGGGS